MKYVKQVAANPLFWIALVYLGFPVDLVPDALPVVGVADDGLLVIAATIVQSFLTTKKLENQPNGNNDNGLSER